MSNQFSNERDRESNLDLSESRGRRRKRQKSTEKKRRLWPVVLIILAAIVFFLPTVIGSTSLRQKAIDWVFSDFDGHISVGSAGIGWFSPIRLNEVAVVDSSGNPLVEVASVTTSRPLVSFLYASDYGDVTLEQPMFHVELRPDGSNLEDALASLLSPETPDSTESLTSPKINLLVRGGQVHIDSTATGENWLVAGNKCTSHPFS